MKETELLRQIDEFIAQNEKNILRDLAELISHKSVKGPAEDGAPYGRGPRNALDCILAQAQRLGFAVNDGDGYVGWAELPGQEKDYPRPFKVIVNQDSTTAREGIDYEALQDEYVVEANNSVAYIPVTLYRQPEMKDETITLGLKLVANDYFSLTFQNFEQLEGHTNGDVVYDSLNATMHTIRINDLLTQPTNWLGSTDASGKEFNVFGVFTEKKFNLICKEFNLTYADFMDSNIMNYTYQMLIGRKMAKLLNEAYHSGNPYLEEDGRLMWVDGCDYTSYPGIPWDGTYE